MPIVILQNGILHNFYDSYKTLNSGKQTTQSNKDIYFY